MALSPLQLQTATNYEEFNVFLIKIADEITEEEVGKMKFLCQQPNNNLPRGKLDPIKEPREFLNFLRKRGKNLAGGRHLLDMASGKCWEHPACRFDQRER
ncbi:hypothetical protein OS493_027988 [Desmophyllum pertusum]|uniref:DED domain-containing protein n=1 Tax=Desmophyllum pertusum TaxID=174260 RepID=A0A9W9Y9B4_9CNID|nr:hypothetical protein OS493_027988 [Desmophyllum pertusum]